VVGVFLPRPSGKVLRWLAVISAVLFIFLTVSATGASPLPALSAAEVIEVIDGSTIRVRAGDREEVVRLIGVGGTEAQPQGQQPEPRESTSESFIRSQLEGRTVYLEKDVQERDEGGRLWAYVWLDRPGEISDQEIRAKMLNAQLLLHGYAELSTIPQNFRYIDFFRTYQAEAQKGGRGLWALRSSDSQDTQDVTVYITQTGKKYHREGCRYLARSKIPISLREAQARGYEPCSVCNPPRSLTPAPSLASSQENSPALPAPLPARASGR
jgi:micrococcal nuclease